MAQTSGFLVPRGMNIFSGSQDGDGLAASLTNPTELARRKGLIKQSYPVAFWGSMYPNAEAAYLTAAWGIRDAFRDALMADIIVAKFEQHPELARRVTELGGVAFLERCRHLTGAKSERFRLWEGFGRGSRFIRNLIAAFESWQLINTTIAQDDLQGALKFSAIPEHGSQTSVALSTVSSAMLDVWHV